eukprot:6085397-Pleurochrysis_carterae.AAC.1
MLNERMVTFELQADMKRLQSEFRQQQGFFDGHGHGIFELEAAFEGLQNNFDVLRSAVQQHRKWLDTQQLELAQIQAQYLPNQEGGVPYAATTTGNYSRTQPDFSPKYENAASSGETPITGRTRSTKRKLSQDTTEDRAMIRVDAPEGISQFIMGAESAADN